MKMQQPVQLFLDKKIVTFHQSELSGIAKGMGNKKTVGKSLDELKELFFRIVCNSMVLEVKTTKDSIRVRSRKNDRSCFAKILDMEIGGNGINVKGAIDRIWGSLITAAYDAEINIQLKARKPSAQILLQLDERMG